jgi:hypothetical protein
VDPHGPLDLLFDSRWWARLLISRLAASLLDLQRALAHRHVCWWIRTVRWTCFLTRGGGLVFGALNGFITFLVLICQSLSLYFFFVPLAGWPGLACQFA